MKYNSKGKDLSYLSAFRELIEMIKEENNNEIKTNEKCDGN